MASISSEFKIDKEFHDLIPPLANGERELLEQKLKSDGCRDALVAWNGLLIDGHNRSEICTRLKIPFKVISIELPDRDAALLWIIDNQKGRRNISDIDRIALTSKREEIVARKAKAQQKSAGGDRKSDKSLMAKLPEPIFVCECGETFDRQVWHCKKCKHHWPMNVEECKNCHDEKRRGSPKARKAGEISTRRESAKAAGVGERTYDAGKKVLKAASEGKIKPEVVEGIRRGEIAIHRVAKDLKEREGRESRESKRAEAALAAPKISDQIIIGDFRKRSDEIADGSVSLIFTDPPYDREASKMLPALGEFAAAKLCEGGSLILYVGQTQIPAALDALRPHLRYWWTIACLHAGRSTVMREYGINAGWKAVLWFVKGTRHDNSIMVNDVMSGGEEKTHHDWQQSQSEAEYWIENLTAQSDLVCDPFLGGGTTAAAAKRLGRKWMGFEIDEATAKIASGRVA